MRAADPDSPYSWAVAAATLVLASLSFGAANSLPMLFPELSAEFGWDGGSVASLYGATMAGAAVSSLLMGRLLDRIGFFPIGVVATLAMCGGMALASVATARWQFYLIYAVLIGGLGQGAFLSTVAAAVSQWFLRSRSLAVAIALCGQGVGGLLVPPLLRAVSGGHGWRDALLAYAAVAVVAMLAAMALYMPRPPVGLGRPRSLAGPPAGAAAPDGGRLIVWLALALLLANSAAAGVASHLVSYGAQAGLSPVRAGALMSAHYGLVLVARLAIGYSLDRLDKYAVLLATTAIQIVGALLLQFTDSIAMVVAGAAAIGIGFGGYYPAYGALMQGHYPKEQVGRRLTELYLASFIAAGFGTWLVGTLFDLRGGRFDLAFFAALLLSMLALGIVLACKSRIAGHGGAKRLALPAQR